MAAFPNIEGVPLSAAGMRQAAFNIYYTHSRFILSTNSKENFS